MIKILEIRENIYNHFHRSEICEKFFYSEVNKDIYAKYYTAMYQLQDSTETLLWHRQKGFSQDSHEAYLEFWGIMQSVIIQQDCIRELYKIFTGKSLNWADDSNWHTLRSFRDLLAGHPLSNKKKKYSFMGRGFGNYQSVQYEQYDVCSATIQHPILNLGKLIDEYAEEASSHINTIFMAMKDKW